MATKAELDYAEMLAWSDRIRIADLRNDVSRYYEGEEDGYLLSRDTFAEALVALLEVVEAARRHHQALTLARQEPLLKALDRFDFGDTEMLA